MNGEEKADQKWSVIVHCLNPICTRKIEPVSAFCLEQAQLIASSKVIQRFGKHGEGWTRFDVYMNMT